MQDQSKWQDIIASIPPLKIKGQDRIRTNEVLDRIGVSAADRNSMAKRLPRFMRSIGWIGPKQMRFPTPCGFVSVAGYWRYPGVATLPVDGQVDRDDGEQGSDLPAMLEGLTRLGMRKMAQVLRMPTNSGDGNLLRAQVTAALGALNAQLRADEARLRTKTAGDVLERLERLMVEQQKLIPKQHLAVFPPAVQPDVELASSNAEGVPLEASAEG